MDAVAPARHAVLGVSVSMVSLDQATNMIVDWADKGRPSTVAVTGVHGVMEAQDDPSFRQILNEASLCVPDGVPLVWCGRAAGYRGISRVFGPDLMLRVSDALARREGSAFYYGGNEGIADELAATLARRFPGLRTAGTFCPPFRDLTEAEEAEIVARINASGADVVWVGLSTPKQERWMAAFRDRLRTPVLIGVGAAFDYNTGRIQRAPAWMQAAGLEWFFRLVQEPRRLWRRYMRNNPRFIWLLARERLAWRGATR